MSNPCPHHSHGEPHSFTSEATPCAKCKAAGCSAPKSHPCDSCNGIGMRYDELRNHPDCPVCLGSGRISDVMPAANAVNDAETLRNVAASQALPLDDFDFRPYPDVASLRCVVDSSLWTRGHFYETEHAMVMDGVWSARAAFRAIPALRGE